MGESETPMLAFVDRLGKLEGLILGLQASISQGQASTTAFMARVERLEQRQVELERNMLKSSDIQSLSEKVDSLITSDATRKGGTAAAKWSISQFAAWFALIIALFSWVGIGVNNGIIQRDQLQEERSR